MTTKNPKNKKHKAVKGKNRPKPKGKGVAPRSRSGSAEKAGSAAPSIPFPLYGFHAVEAAWLNPERRIKALYISENALEAFEPVMHKAASAGIERPQPQIAEKAAIDTILPKGAVHQGIAVAATPLPEFVAQDLVIRAQSLEQGRSILVMLDQVTDPHNVGAILRSACAFGAQGMIMQRKHAPELSGVLAKIATGALEYVPVAQETNLARAIEQLQEAGYFVIGLDEHEDNTIASIGVRDHDKLVLVLGSEGDGMRRLVREKCDVIAQLPTSGAIKSLNVSNAAAVALYAL